MTQAPPTSTHLSDAPQAVQHREVEGAIPKGCISEDTQTQIQTVKLGHAEITDTSVS